ncbi:uncharacterized protein N7498_001503 [Penicillium cinerascens]|uniref:GPI anchored serine-threonine rich protein n=1 Tax=Penicillium cinerascens TaxID=70096 RepID=A0A9W9NG97_9EURO|nr:uncharacterized protein N7498_001503 [Penicillium cinerascens]KAJ5219404.1 hypothetical protein N7498_001503 [Penicillium cinerascens]
MKFNILAISTLLALAAAETTTTAQTATVTLTPEQSCANKCRTTERCCVADCYKVPCPSESQANDTNKCVAACPQGTGTPADTKRYTECQQNCFNSHFLATGTAATETGSTTFTDTTTGTATATTTSTWATATTTSDSDSSNNDASSTFGSGSGTSTNTGVVKSTNAAANVKLGASSAGLFGLVVAAFAL